MQNQEKPGHRQRSFSQLVRPAKEATGESAHPRDWDEGDTGQVRTDDIEASDGHVVTSGEEVAEDDVAVETDRDAGASSGAPAREVMAKPKPTIADLLLAQTHDMELFHTEDEKAYVVYRVGGHRETWPVESKRFARRLGHLLYDVSGRTPNQGVLGDVTNVLAGKALYDGPMRSVHLRVAEATGALYLDLANADWQVVEVTAAGWRVLDETPVYFRRTQAMKPLPLPLRGGSMDELREFVNVGEDDWILLCSWLVAALWPTGPYPVLDVVGEQGSAKSTTARVLRSLIDPSKALLQSPPTDERNLMVAASNSWVLALDNISFIPQWLSDALCRLATGGGYAHRLLYTDAEELVLEAQRPTIMTAIGENFRRPDLLDRGLMINQPPIREAQRLPETLLWARFEAAAPRVLGALLDAVVGALATEPTLELATHPRMADFARRACAAASTLGWTSHDFSNAYDTNRTDLNTIALEDAIIAPFIFGVVEEDDFLGTAAELFQKFHDTVDENTRKAKGAPKNASGLSTQLKKHAPNFRARGIEITWYRTNKARLIRIARVGAAAPNPAGTGDDGDGDDDHSARDVTPTEIEVEPAASNELERMVRQELAAVRPEDETTPKFRKPAYRGRFAALAQELEKEDEEDKARRALQRTELASELAASYDQPDTPENWEKREKVLKQLSDLEQQDIPASVRQERNRPRPRW